MYRQKILNCVCVRVCVCACVRVCVRACVSKESSFLSWNICHSSSAISENKFSWNRGKIGLLLMFQYFRLGKTPSFSVPKFWCLGNFKRNMEGLNVKELPNHILSHVRLLSFCVLGQRTNQKKNSKLIWRELRQWFIMGTNYNYNYNL